MAVDRKILQQALLNAQNLGQRATAGQGFDPRGGSAVAALQIATAGIGAFAKNRARKKLAELEQQEQAAFSTAFPGLSPELAAQTSPETRQAAIQAQLSGRIKQQFADAPKPLSPEGKRAADIKGGFLKEGASLESVDDIEKKRATSFKETRDLRKEFTKNSGEFIKSRDAFDRIQASIETSSLPNSPRGAGDLALIFNYMKLLDPGSTVRESEFETAGNARALLDKGVPTWLVKQRDKVLEGAFVTDEQRKDFAERSDKLFDRSLKRQKKRVNQFTGIAERNELPVGDVILDLIGSIDDPQAKQDVVETIGEVSAPEPAPPQYTPEYIQGAQAQIEKRKQEAAIASITTGGIR